MGLYGALHESTWIYIGLHGGLHGSMWVYMGLCESTSVYTQVYAEIYVMSTTLFAFHFVVLL